LIRKNAARHPGRTCEQIEEEAMPRRIVDGE
jgi:hypothetical protein